MDVICCSSADPQWQYEQRPREHYLVLPKSTLLVLMGNSIPICIAELR